MKFKKFTIASAIIFAFLSLAPFKLPYVATAIAAKNDIPTGCPGGPVGTKDPGVTCPAETNVCGTIPDDQCNRILEAPINADNPLGGLTVLLDWIVNIVTGLFVAATVLVIVISGVQISASAGNSNIIASAKGNIFKAVAGLALLISSRAILSIFGIYDAGVTITPPVTLFKDVNTSELSGLQTIIANAITITVSLAGVVSVIFVMIGGVRYILSAGNPDGIKNAKNTIMYALVGLIISIFAYGIVSFVIGRIQ